MSKLNKIRVPETKCLRCGRPISAATGVNHESRPKQGDWSVCLNCGMLAIFTEKLGLRVPTVAELAAISHDQRVEIKRIQENILLQRGVVMELEDTPANRLKVELLRRQKEARMEPMVVIMNSNPKKRS